MPKLAKQLSDALVSRARPGPKVKKLFDGRGLYLEIQPSGAKAWRIRFRQTNGKETVLSFGPYPEVGLAKAREMRTEARRTLLAGSDPIQQRELEKRAKVRASECTFRKVATEWHELKCKSWSPAYGKNVLTRLELDINEL